jgi:tetratricopeptide (TPR) repeat protein
LLKLNDPAMATLAADRSTHAARRSGLPVVMASSARAQVHSLLAIGHECAAVKLAVAAAQQQDRGAPAAEISISIRGALLLRAATAAARREDRDTANDLLLEAERIGGILGRDANLAWTAFGPTNVLLHRIAAAVDLGDAGVALDLANTVNPMAVALPERRATLYLDIARAYLQWGKFDQSFRAIRVAEQQAPEEVRSRPKVHRIVADLSYRSSSRLKTQVNRFAASIGVAA